MKAVMISIRPNWCEMIANGMKTVEVRKTKPKLETPFKCYIYCTNQRHYVDSKHQYSYPEEPLFLAESKLFNNQKKVVRKLVNGYFAVELLNGKVIGEFVCDFFDEFTPTKSGVRFKRFSALHESALSAKEILMYLCGKQGYGWHISDLKIYDKPRVLNEFLKPCITPEQPYCPMCPVGYEYIGDAEADAFRADGTCNTQWRCLNHIERPPQSWCYVNEL